MFLSDQKITYLKTSVKVHFQDHFGQKFKMWKKSRKFLVTHRKNSEKKLVFPCIFQNVIFQAIWQKYHWCIKKRDDIVVYAR
jgi:heme-degrading monooxygenase HmoA